MPRARCRSPSYRRQRRGHSGCRRGEVIIQGLADAYRERIGVVESAAELGIIEYDAGRQAIQLDEAAAALHGLAEQSIRSLPIDSWSALLVREDQLRAHSLLISGVA